MRALSRVVSSSVRVSAASMAIRSASAAPYLPLLRRSAPFSTAKDTSSASTPEVAASESSKLAREDDDDDLDSGDHHDGEDDSFTYDFDANPVKVAVVLAGSGVYDGSEITEATSALIHFSANGCATSCFAPDKPQAHVVNHLTGEVVPGETRNTLVEAARIARGAVAPLTQLKAKDFDALFFPGGFGVAKNLSTFANDGDKLTIDSEVARAVNEFLAAKKPMGLVCISPVIAAKLVPGVTVTVGGETESPEWPNAGAVGAIKALGATHVPTTIEEAYVDVTTNVVTAPAYMSGTAQPHQVFDNIGHVVDAVLALAKDQITAKAEAAATAAEEVAAAAPAAAETVKASA